MTDRPRNQAETRRNASSALARMFAVWRTGLPRPVLVLQGGFALNFFGTGLILPFEIIYLYAFQGLYLFDTVSFAVFALVVLAWIPNPGVANAASMSESGEGFRAVVRD